MKRMKRKNPSMRMTKTTRKSRFPLWHPFLPSSHPIRVTLLVCGWVALATGLAPASPVSEVPAAGSQSPQKKVRWRAMSDRRGEFGIRVPLGAEYEVAIHARGFAKAERKVDGKVGQRFDFLVRLQPVPSKGKEPAKSS